MTQSGWARAADLTGVAEYFGHQRAARMPQLYLRADAFRECLGVPPLDE